ESCEEELGVLDVDVEATAKRVHFLGLERELVVVAVLRDAEPSGEMLAAPDERPAHRAVLVEEGAPARVERIGEDVHEAVERLEMMQDHRTERGVERTERGDVERVRHDRADVRDAALAAVLLEVRDG